MTLTPQQLRFRRPDDWHVHLRDGDMLESVVAHTAQQFARAIVMPNLTPPITTTEQALAYKTRIETALQATPEAPAFTPLMTLYLTDNTPAAEIAKAKASGVVHAVKLYPAGATTNSDAGVTDLLKHCGAVLEALQAHQMPLLVHGEVTDPAIDVFDREAVFIDRVMLPLRQRFPELKVVFEHITTKEGADYVATAEGPIAATITPQHLLYNRNALFSGGLRPHWYCLPVLKREKHRQALLAAATSGSGRFFLGTDSAPHVKGRKEMDCGCAGCYSALHALELYAQTFDSVGKLDRFEAFASLNGPAFYNLPVNNDYVILERVQNTIPQVLDVKAGELVPLAAGEQLAWRLTTEA